MPASSTPPIILDKQLSGLDTDGAANYPVVHNSLPSHSPTNSIIHPPVATVQHSYSHVRRPIPDMDLKSGINPSIGQGTANRSFIGSDVQYAAGQFIFYTQPESSSISSSGSFLWGVKPQRTRDST